MRLFYLLGILMTSSCLCKEISPYTSINSKPIQYHVIATQPRSGSTYFSTLLRSHPCIVCYMERYTVTRAGDVRSALFNAVSKNSTLVNDCPAGPLSVGVKNMLFENSKVPGLKNEFLNLQRSDMVDALGSYLQRCDFRVVLFLRRNMLEFYISRHSGTLRLPQHCTTTASAAKQKKCDTSSTKTIKVNIRELIEFARRMTTIQTAAVNGFSRIANEYNVPVLYVPYEYLVQNKHDVEEKVIDFLNITSLNKTLSSSYQKRIQSKMSSIIVNWNEVEDAMKKFCPSCVYDQEPILGMPAEQGDMRLLST